MAIKDKTWFVVFFLAAKSALEKHQSPVIIDNTNTQAWEMKPYVSMVREFIYCKRPFCCHGISACSSLKVKECKNAIERLLCSYLFPIQTESKSQWELMEQSWKRVIVINWPHVYSVWVQPSWEYLSSTWHYNRTSSCDHLL